mgnify:CR=1 FL=1
MISPLVVPRLSSLNVLSCPLPEQTPFAIAGLWRIEHEDLRGDDETGLRYTMVTTEANDLVRPIHAKGRMPVILEPEDYETWLTGPIEKARALLRPFSSEKMRIIKHGFDEKQDLSPGLR